MPSHSPQFVEEMKIKLLDEKTQLERELGALGHKQRRDYVADFPSYGHNDEENASEVADYQAAFATTEAIEERLRGVEEALARIDKGSYGVTAEGELIPEARLRANPAATTLVK